MVTLPVPLQLSHRLVDLDVEKLVLRRLLHEVAKHLRSARLPETYVVFDTETTGVDPLACRAVQYGLTFVRNRKRVGSFSQVVKLPSDVALPAGAVAVHGITRERMAKEGSPIEALMPMMIDTFKTWRKEGALFMGHNAMAFDIAIFHREAAALNLDFRFAEDEVVDTGMLVKAAQLGASLTEGDNLLSFYARIYKIRAKGLYWALPKYCYQTFNLAKYGVDITKAHDAGVDCDLVHYLFEELRGIAEEPIGEPANGNR